MDSSGWAFIGAYRRHGHHYSGDRLFRGRGRAAPREGCLRCRQGDRRGTWSSAAAIVITLAVGMALKPRAERLGPADRR
jgi:hypothetical protein